MTKRLALFGAFCFLLGTATLVLGQGTGVLRPEVFISLPWVWSGAQSSLPCPLTDASTITVSATTCAASASDGVAFQTVTLGGNRTLGNPSGLVAGQTITFRITQDGTGSRTLAYSSDYIFAGGAPTLTTTAAAVDMITCWSATTTELDCVAALNVH